MVILLILIHGLLLSTLLAERTMGCKVVYFTRQRFAFAIIDAELGSLFVNIWRISVSAVALLTYSFHKCKLRSGTCPLRP